MMQSECDKPRCHKQSTKTYTGENGNSLKLCAKHYYNLVSGYTTPEINIDSDTPINPFWGSGFRCDNTTTSPDGWTYPTDLTD